MKKIISSLLATGILSLNLFAIETNKIDSIVLFNVDLEKTIIEEMVSSITHEQNIFDMYNTYILKTGDTDTKIDTNGNGITFYDWYQIEDNANNNFLSAYNHNGIIDLEYNNYSLIIKDTFKKANNYAYDRYISELKKRNIKYELVADANGVELSSVKYKLPLKTIKFLYKYTEIISQGLLILNENDIVDNAKIANALSLAAKTSSDVYVPDGEGGFIMYNVNSLTSPITVDYKGIIKTFEGVVVEGSTDDTILQNRLNEKLPKIKGSVGYVIMDIKDENGLWIKSAIIEYIYDGSIWKKRYSTVNRESYVTTSAKDYYDSDLAMVGNTNINIKNVNMFESTFVGGLYNTTNIDYENSVVYQDPFDIFGNQYKEVFFKPISINGIYNFEKIYAKSYVYSNVNLDKIGGSIEQLELLAENKESGYELKPDISACDYGYSYDSTIKKCVKESNSCSDSNSKLITYNNKTYCKAGSGNDFSHRTSDSDHLCKYLGNDWGINIGVDSNKCSDKITKEYAEYNYCGKDSTNGVKNGEYVCTWKPSTNYEYVNVKKYNNEYYRVAITNNYNVCEYYDGDRGSQNPGNFFVYGEGNYKDGCYYNVTTSKSYKAPSCDWDEIMVDGVCKDIYGGNIKNAECNGDSILAVKKFQDLIENYYFKNDSDKNEYAFGSLQHYDTHISYKDQITGKTYNVCESVKYSQKAYKKYYVYPSFDIEILDVLNQGKHEVNIAGSSYTYKEIIISECDYLGANCQAIFDKNDLRNGMNNNSNVKYSYGNVFDYSQNMSFNNSSKFFEVRKVDFANNQSLPYSTFSTIDTKLNEITNSSNNRTIKVKALQFEIVNSNNKRMEANSGEIVK